MYELLMSADMMVPHPDATARMLVDRLGLATHPNWRQAFPDHPYVAWFLRTHKSLAVAPTRIEPQGHLDRPNTGDPLFPEHLHSLIDFQGPARPVKTHSTVLIVDDLRPVVERLEAQKQPFRIARITPEMTWDRLWVGVTPEHCQYEPSVDGGLCLEIMECWPLQMPESAWEAPEPRDAKPGDMVRITSRGYIVRDLDDTLARIDRNLGLVPEGPVERLDDEGYRHASIGFNMRHSAKLDLIQPTDFRSLTGYYLHNWGPGPYSFRISVVGLEAKAEDLRARGTNFEWVESSSAVDGRSLIRVDPESLDGLVCEFEEHIPLH